MTAAGQPIRVLLVDDHPVVVDGVRALLAAEPGIEVSGTGRSAAAAIELIDRERPDVVYVVKGAPGSDLVAAIRAAAAGSTGSVPT